MALARARRRPPQNSRLTWSRRVQSGRRASPWVSLAVLGLLTSQVGCAAFSTTPDGRPIARPGRLFQAEDLPTRTGRFIATPLAGMRLFANGDQLRGAASFPSVGRYRFHVTGASSNDERAGITLFLADMAAGTVFFSGRHASQASFLADVEEAGVLPLRWQLTTSVGVSETLLDNFWYEREGDLMAPPRPPSQGSGLMGNERNLLVERGIAPADVDAKLEVAFDGLFRSGPQSIYRRFGSNAHGPLAVIDEPGFTDIRGEAMALGLLVAVELDQQSEFDALWNAIHSLMGREPTSTLPGSFARTLRADGRIKDPAPSAEAEADAATALLFASGRWGDRAAPYDYGVEARRVLRNMRSATVHASPRSNGEAGGPSSLFTERYQPRAFLTDAGGSKSELTAPRLYQPAFYELWARYGLREDARFWQEAVSAARDFLVRAAHPLTGLWPGVATMQGEPASLTGDPGAASFRRESWRVLFNLAVDVAWWAADPRETDLIDRVHGFFVRQGLGTYGDAFTLNGEPTSREHAPGLVAMNAAGAAGSSDPYGWRFVDELWALPFGLGRRPTSDSLLQLLGLLQVAGRFRVWVPDRPTASH